MYVITSEFQKNLLICLKSSNLAFEGQKRPCHSRPTVAPNTVEKLGIELSFSSSLDTHEDSRQNETLLGYHPTFSVQPKIQPFEISNFQMKHPVHPFKSVNTM